MTNGAAPRVEEAGASRIALIGCVVLAGFVIWLAAGPLTTNDLWWHLAHGRAVVADGLWGETDPCLATATGGAVPHQWLFGLSAHGVESVAGLHGLRVVHALAVAALAGLAFAVLRRQAASVAVAAAALAVFLVLSWYRLIQLRPELFSIAAVLLLERWLFAPTLPGWKLVAAAVGLVALWANLHAAFMVGPLLIGAALAGCLLEFCAGRWAGLANVRAVSQRALRLGVALGGGLFAALANPRGIDQHLAFLASSEEGGIWGVVDEWARFDPFARTNVAPAVSDLAWFVTDALLVGLVALALWNFARFVSRPGVDTLARWNPVRLALALAGCVGLLASIRFSWLALFPLLYLAAQMRSLGTEEAFGSRVWVARAAALASVLLAVCFPLRGGFREAAAVFPDGTSEWLSSAYTERRFHSEGVRFLAEAGVTGTIFHPYGMGGLLCHQLGPALRTFVDGSMNVPADVTTDYRKVMEHAGSRPGESPDDVLRRRGVDVFFGVGVPMGPLEQGTTRAYTTTLLESVPGWILVSRSLRHAIYLRDDASNHANRARVAAWYAKRKVPYRADEGLDPGAALREAPEWATEWGLAPKSFREARATADAGKPGHAAAALETVGLAYVLAGAYADAVSSGHDSVARRPRAQEPRQRLVYALLHAGEDAAARIQAQALVALDPLDPRSAAFLRGVERAAGASSVAERNAALAALPLLSSRSPLRQ